jgi:hypothetical protein
LTTVIIEGSGSLGSCLAINNSSESDDNKNRQKINQTCFMIEVHLACLVIVPMTEEEGVFGFLRSPSPSPQYKDDQNVRLFPFPVVI